MIHIAVIDDDYRTIADITQALVNFYGKDEYDQDDFKDGLEFTRNLGSPVKYDIVFVDIEMEHMNGEETIRKLREIDINENIYVIYVSSHTDNLYNLFSLHPFDFIVKPIDYDRVAEVLRKISTSMMDRRAEITVIENRKEVRIRLSEIKYIQSEAHKIKIILNTSSEPISCYMKMDSLHKKIQEKSSDFIRVHASFIVNRCYVSRYLKNAVLIGNVEIPISNRYRNEMMSNIHKGV